MLKATSKPSLLKSKQSTSKPTTNQKLTSTKRNTKNVQHKKLLTEIKIHRSCVCCNIVVFVFKNRIIY